MAYTSDSSNNEVSSSGILRARYKAQLIKKNVERLRNSLPKYNIEQIREFRLPYHEALTINLEEQGFVSTAAYINQLIEFQDEMRKDATPGSSIAMRPQLKQSRDEIQFLTQKLKLSETYHNEQKVIEECEEFLKLGIHFAFNHIDWWWLGEQILIQSIKVSSGYQSLEGKYEALSRYSYARFLVEKLREYQKAADQLEITSNISFGKGWTSISYFPEVRGTLYMQANHALSECMLRDVKTVMKTDPKRAIKMSNEARSKASEGCHYIGQCKAYVLKGLCEMAISDTKSAVSSLLRALGIQREFGTVEGMCEIRIYLAKAYLLDDCRNESLKVLVDLKQDAEEYDLPVYLGQAYRHLGDYYLSRAAPDMANPLLKESLKILKECNVNVEDIALVRNLEAISAGLQLFPKFIEVLNNADRTKNRSLNEKNITKLIDWKDQRSEFWEPEDNLRKTECVEDIINRSLRKVHESRMDIVDQRFKALSAPILKRTKELQTMKEKSGLEDLEIEHDDQMKDKTRKVTLQSTVSHSEDKIVDILHHNPTEAVPSKAIIVDSEGWEHDSVDDDLNETNI